MIYVDSSALLKLLHPEAESAALGSWLAARPGVPVVSSDLARVEVLRACRRLDEASLPAAVALLEGTDLVPTSSTVVDGAIEVGDVALRSLDAIHLSSALLIRDELSAFVAYDHRLHDAAVTVGLPVTRPGA